MVFKNQQELEAYADWAKVELRGMADHARNSDLFQEEAVGHAVWTLPQRLFIGKVWPKSDRDRAFWVISGVDIPTDHIESSLAETAREAARHFSMKWQLQSARLGDLREQDESAGPESDVEWDQVAGKLRAQAEALYGLVEQEDIWRQTEGPLLDKQS
ncbi:MAG: DUF4826 family protein [Gammaproteobacteria bacterium]|nr:MAG: DUF4826 family protein [Gammaproteobacteria bacterium]